MVVPNQDGMSDNRDLVAKPEPAVPRTLGGSIVRQWRDAVRPVEPATPPDRALGAILPRPLPRLAIVGHSGCGKDIAADWLSLNTPLVRPGSLSTYLCYHVTAYRRNLPLADVLAGKYENECAEEYAQRHENHEVWEAVADRARDTDPLVLVRPAIKAGGHLLVGSRDPREVIAAQVAGYIDLILWMDRPVALDPTLKFGPDTFDCVVIRNHDDKPALYRRLYRLCRFAGIL